MFHAGRFSPRGEEGAVVSLPALDNAKLLAEETGGHGGYQFARPIDVKLTLEDGRWTTRADGTKAWTLTVRSRTATSLSAVFDNFHLPAGGEFYVYTHDTVRGAFTSANNKAHGWFSTAPLRGNALTFAYIQPADVEELPEISIAKIAHGYKEAFGDAGRCNINVVCPEGREWRDQIRGVAMMLTEFGSRYCSGSMINNALNDGRQLFLTAKHCTGGDMYADQLMFNYESEICDVAEQEDGNTESTVSGLQMLASYSSSDFALFEVEETIPDSWNVFLNGFSAENVAPYNMVGIHHPSGDIKKICWTNETGVADWYSEAPNKFHWEVPHWDDGTTEPGSSGSPLFDQNYRIVGQLHGGAASCTNTGGYDSYGAVWASWDQGTEKLQEFLDPESSGVRIVEGIDLATARRARN